MPKDPDIYQQDDHHEVKIILEDHLPGGLELTLEVIFKDGSPMYIACYMAVPATAMNFPVSMRQTLLSQNCDVPLVDRVIEDLETLMRREALTLPPQDPRDNRN